jgi:L-threonylcarbamoyladenylate synthase
MKTEIISAIDPEMLSRAVAILKSGGLVVMPTDTVYGLGALAFNSNAVKDIYFAKGRSKEKALPILIGDPSDLKIIAHNITPMAQVLAEHFWPGPLTIVVEKNPAIPDAVSPFPTVGVRVPNHPITRKILRASGPMAVTSANLSGKENPCNAQEVFDQLNARIHLIIDAGQVGNGLASTVVNCMESDPIILREGPITLEQIKQVLGLSQASRD